MNKRAVLLINLGTPDAPTPWCVMRYLREFLSDKRVIDIPLWARVLLVYGIILPFRSFKSAKAYQTIWTTEGSPLMAESLKLATSLQTTVGNSVTVVLAMRYGQPSIDKVLKKLLAMQVAELIVLPLYPQYASSSTGTALEEVYQVLCQANNLPKIRVINQFFEQEGFIAAQSGLIARHVGALAQKPEKLLFSFHSLPERHIKKTGCIYGVCEKEKICPAVDQNNQYCYRAQCFQTASKIAEKLEYNSENYAVCFQSKLGRTPWIGPDIEEKMQEMFEQGTRHLAVACPSFIVDCLETLEEVNMRARSFWLKLGGESFHYLPCLNADDRFVETLKGMIQKP